MKAFLIIIKMININNISVSAVNTVCTEIVAGKNTPVAGRIIVLIPAISSGDTARPITRAESIGTIY